MTGTSEAPLGGHPAGSAGGSDEDRRLLYTPAHELARMIRQRELSPVELMEATLRRIGALNPSLSAYITVDEEGALQAARTAADEIATGRPVGVLHGVPVSIKDTTPTKGLRTTCGSVLLRDAVPAADAIVVERLRQAGGIVVGKTNVPEFANAFSGENRLVDPCRNPWDLERSCNGSSSGAAASVAAGIGPIAQGTDGGGSIRAPAAACGVYGIKPSSTVNRVPFDVDPISGHSFNFCTHGPITRTVRDAARVLDAISGPHPAAYSCIPTPAPAFEAALDSARRPLRIAWSPTLGYADAYGVDPEYIAVVEQTVQRLEELGHIVEEATPPAGNPIWAWERVVTAQVVEGLEPLYDEHSDELMVYNRQFVEFARSLTGIEVANAFQDMVRLADTMERFMERYDLLVCPTLGSPPQRIGAIVEQPYPDYFTCFNWEFCAYTPLFNLTGNPSASVPCGFTAGGLPVGVQLVGRLGDEVTVLQTSAALEEVHPWSSTLPPVS